MKKLALKQLNTLQDLMDKVEEFINQEENLKVMVSSRQPCDVPHRLGMEMCLYV
jgi:hypothetical protein